MAIRKLIKIIAPLAVLSWLGCPGAIPSPGPAAAESSTASIAGTVTINAAAQAGADWAAKINAAVKACGDIPAPCVIDARTLTPDQARTHVVLDRVSGPTHLILGAATYQFAPGYGLTVRGKGAGSVNDRTEISGQGMTATTIQCGSGPGSVNCVRAVGSVTNSKIAYNPYLTTVLTQKPGDTQITAATNDPEAARLRVGDLIVVEDMTVSPADMSTFAGKIVEFKTVSSVNAANGLITLNEPLQYSYGTYGRLGWFKMDPRIDHFSIHDLSINNRDNRAAALYMIYMRWASVYRVRLLATAPMTGGYMMDAYNGLAYKITDNLIQGGAPGVRAGIELGGSPNSLVAHNRLSCFGSGAPTALKVDDGSNGSTIEGNVIGCAIAEGGSLVFMDVNNVKVVGNSLAGGGLQSTSGLQLIGSSSGTFSNNVASGFTVGYKISNDNIGPSAGAWAPSTRYPATGCVVAPVDSGWIYCTNVACESGAALPVWNHVNAGYYDQPGAGTGDGTCNWFGDLYMLSTGNTFTNNTGRNLSAAGVQIYHRAYEGAAPSDNSFQGTDLDSSVRAKFQDLGNPGTL